MDIRRFSPALSLLLLLSARAEEFAFKGQVRTEEPLTAWRHATPDSVATSGTFRVAAYNLEHFTDAVGDDPARTSARLHRQARRAAELLNEINAALVLLMEIENADALKVLGTYLTPRYAEACITRLGDGSPDESKLNLAVLSRWPLAGVKEVDFGPLTGPGRPTRGYLRAILELDGPHRLVLYVVHLKSNFGNRPRNIAQRVHTLELIAEDARALAASDPSLQWEMLVAGDTNVDPELPEFAGDESLAPLREWKDLWRGRPLHERITIPTRYGEPALEFPPACFDRLFASRELTRPPWVAGAPHVLPRGVETRQVTVRPGEGEHVSDHYPVYVDLTR